MKNRHNFNGSRPAAGDCAAHLSADSRLNSEISNPRLGLLNLKSQISNLKSRACGPWISNLKSRAYGPWNGRTPDCSVPVAAPSKKCSHVRAVMGGYGHLWTLILGSPTLTWAGDFKRPGTGSRTPPCGPGTRDSGLNSEISNQRRTVDSELRPPAGRPPPGAYPSFPGCG